MSYSRKAEKQEDQTVSNQCQAHGCPLIGTCTDATLAHSGSTHWYCSWHHDEQNASNWAGITQRIRRNRSIYQHYAQLIQTAALQFNDYRNSFQLRGHPDLDPDPEESYVEYKSRVYKAFSDAVTGGA